MPSIKRYAEALKDYFTKGETGDAAFVETKFYGIGANPALIAQHNIARILVPSDSLG